MPVAGSRGARLAVLALLLAVFVPGTAAAQCLELGYERPGILYFYNRCSVGVDVAYRTIDGVGCESNRTSKYPCGTYVKPAGGTRIVSGRSVDWVECRSPGGLGDVIAVEREYGRVYCSD